MTQSHYYGESSPSTWLERMWTNTFLRVDLVWKSSLIWKHKTWLSLLHQRRMGNPLVVTSRATITKRKRHKTDDCRTLKHDIESLIRKDLLKKFVEQLERSHTPSQRWGSPGSNNPVPSRSTRGTINEIAGGFTAGGTWPMLEKYTPPKCPPPYSWERIHNFENRSSSPFPRKTRLTWQLMMMPWW